MRRKDLDWAHPQSDYSLSKKAGKLAMVCHIPTMCILWILILVFWDELHSIGIEYDTWKFWLMGWGIMIVPYYVYQVFIKQILNILAED